MPAFDLESYIIFIMEDLDSRLFIAGVEVYCWQDQPETSSKYYCLSILNHISSIFILYI